MLTISQELRDIADRLDRSAGVPTAAPDKPAAPASPSAPAAPPVSIAPLLESVLREARALEDKGASVSGIRDFVLRIKVRGINAGGKSVDVSDLVQMLQGELEPLASKFDVSALATVIGDLVVATGAGGGVLVGEVDTKDDFVQG